MLKENRSTSTKIIIVAAAAASITGWHMSESPIQDLKIVDAVIDNEGNSQIWQFKGLATAMLFYENHYDAVVESGQTVDFVTIQKKVSNFMHTTFKHGCGATFANTNNIQTHYDHHCHWLHFHRVKWNCQVLLVVLLLGRVKNEKCPSKFHRICSLS